MTVLVEGKDSFWLGASAHILDTDHETAWAEKHIVHNPAYKWIVGRYVEADNANNNRQLWSFADLQMAQPSIQHAPMNLLHQPRRIVGAFVDTEMMYPTATAADGSGGNPFIEALGVYWGYYFREELGLIQRAHDEGKLFFSMECVAKTITCAGLESCGKEFEYRGPKSPSYCSHINDGPATKQLNDPLFLGGALLIPPVAPGWSDAHISDISSLVKQNADECEMAYENIQTQMPNASPSDWETMMLQLMKIAKLG